MRSFGGKVLNNSNNNNCMFAVLLFVDSFILYVYTHMWYAMIRRERKRESGGDSKLSIIYKLIDRFLIIIDRSNRMISFENEVPFVMLAFALAPTLSLIHSIYAHPSVDLSLSLYSSFLLLVLFVCARVIFHNLSALCVNLKYIFFS